MLNRLSFELVERQRYVARSRHTDCPIDARHRLDLQKKEITQAKDDLLKESKAKQNVMDNVKTQIEKLLLVRIPLIPHLNHVLTGLRSRQKLKRKSTNSLHP